MAREKSSIPFRERNNIARRECYRRSKERNDGVAFERFCVKHHRDAFGHDVWHNSVIPEEELFEAGMIHDFNRHRLNRIARSRELAGKAVLYSDYGMDFLAKETTPEQVIYHAGQAKNYADRRVSAKDIGSFLAILMGQIRNPGYLYTTTQLEVNLRETVQNMRGQVIHANLKRQFEEDIIRSSGINSNTPLEERDRPLRPAQQEAVDIACGKTGQIAIEACCGFGKTLVTGHICNRSKDIYPRFVFIAPLRISVKNLYDRIQPFLEGYQCLLVDSDSGGTTDPDVVDDALAKSASVAFSSHPLAIFSTFKSAEDVLKSIFEKHPSLLDTTYLVVDEVHNMVHQDGVCSFYQMFQKSMALSATIPEEFYEKFEDVERVFQYGVAQGIQEGYICDYEVLLPHIIYHPEYRVLSTDDTNEYAIKCMFLLTGMLRVGSRRCIVYLPSQRDCDVFNDTITKMARDEHGLRLWTEKVIAETRTVERERILCEFQKENNEEEFDMRILASVRILDEAVDIPRCDSEFITNVSDHTCEIRTVQRLMRGGRLDPCNPERRKEDKRVSFLFSIYKR